MHFSGLEKSWILGKMADVMKSREMSFFGRSISCCLKTENIFFAIEQKYAPRMLGFQQFLVMENVNWSWKSR